MIFLGELVGQGNDDNHSSHLIISQQNNKPFIVLKMAQRCGAHVQIIRNKDDFIRFFVFPKLYRGK